MPETPGTKSKAPIYTSLLVSKMWPKAVHTRRRDRRHSDVCFPRFASRPNLLIANDENVTVVQELRRHANSRSKLEIYSQARMEAKRRAQPRRVQAIFPDRIDAPTAVTRRVSY